ncbi:uncharacterized protein EI90DRAFT_2506259 [Cantharellus anzutake]|uniref:uncharacterized protein n=1 Tax=Cantharellus anzutake TaxID=1750568 RepID=UPI001907B3E3|nr:uncharacterized protein EI90DRAFT_2506259 [Cantharellus anzutake]KAF8321381.1 hypothetical protein EI90DRAFT_2506259 [Cantharellus anzutake]
MDTIMENLDARSLASLNEALQPTPSKWISSYDGFRITLQRVIRVLTRFFPDPHAFADCMCETGAIIGGSTALCIFNGEPWLPGDLDVVVSPTFAPRLMEFVGSNGYVQEDKKVDPYDPPNGVFTSRPFSWFCYRKGDRKIDISTTRKGTPADFIGTYHHSYVMNFICHDGLYSFFPEDTSARRGRVNSYEKEHKAAAAREKYRERGYEVIDDLPIQTFTGDYGHILIHEIKNFWLQKLPLTTSDYRKFCQERSARDKAFQKQVRSSSCLYSIPWISLIVSQRT